MDEVDNIQIQYFTCQLESYSKKKYFLMIEIAPKYDWLFARLRFSAKISIKSIRRQDIWTTKELSSVYIQKKGHFLLFFYP